MKKITALLLALVLCICFVGCSALKLNQEKDDARTVASINGEKLTKKDFREFYKYNCIVYEINGYALPEDEEKIDEFIQSVYDNFVLLHLMKLEVEANGIEKLASDAGYTFDSETEVEALVQSAVTKYTTQEAFGEMLENYGYDIESFKALAKAEMSLGQNSTLYTDYGLKFCEVGKQTALSVNGKEIPAYYVYYYTANYIIEYYYENGTYISSKSDVFSAFDSVADLLASVQGVIDYAEKLGITLNDEELAAGKSEASMIDLYMGADSMKTYYRDYLVSDEQVEELRNYMAKYYAYLAKLESEISGKLKDVSEADLNTYFETNIDTYDESKVSAYHILTSDEAFYNELVKEAGNTPEGFMAVYEKYASDSKVSQASDLGSFARGEMLDEFEAAVFSANVGDIVSGIKTTYGYHLVYVYDRTGTTPKLSDVIDTVKKDYVEKNTESEMKTLTENIDKELTKTKTEFTLLPSEQLKDELVKKYSAKLHSKVALAR